MTAVLVPLDHATAHGVGPRAEAWGFVLRHVVEYGWLVTTGLSGSPWVKADAVADALARTDASVLVVHDADVLAHEVALRSAVQLVEGGAAWAVPHGEVHRYDEASTRALYDDDHGHRPQLVRRPYVGVVGGGIVVVRREVYEDCPLDPRFIGWGGEDQAWGCALSTLHGPPVRFSFPLVHLWHPHAAPGAQRPPRQASELLRRAYRGAEHQQGPMRALVDGATVPAHG